MKRILLITAFALFSTVFVFGQYVIDFYDCRTFQTTCGSVGSSQWIVKNQRCSLLIPDLVMQDLLGNYIVPFTFTINQSGNLEYEDSLVLFHRINNGPWGIDTVIHGNGITSVREITDSFFLAYHDTARFILQLETDENSEFWAIKSGDIAINNAEPVLFLPVEMIYFDAEFVEDEKMIHLSWATASETNSSHFVLSRSENGIDFKNVMIVPAAGNSSWLIEYDVSDYDIPPNSVLFYRLQQYDLDGLLSDQFLVAVILSESGNDLWVYSFNQKHLITFEDITGNSLLEIFDLQGRLLLQEELSENTSMYIVDPDVLKSEGVYIVKCSGQNYVNSGKIVYQ